MRMPADFCASTCQSTDPSKFSRANLKRIKDSMNDRPRKTLGFLKPVEKPSELVALTTWNRPDPQHRRARSLDIGTVGTLDAGILDDFCAIIIE